MTELREQLFAEPELGDESVAIGHARELYLEASAHASYLHGLKDAPSSRLASTCDTASPRYGSRE